MCRVLLVVTMETMAQTDANNGRELHEGYVAIYVPGEDRGISFIAERSGIVGRARGMWVDVWYEGNLYGAVNLEGWIEKVACAAGRLQDGYPTRARAAVPAEWVRRVGWYDLQTGVAHLEDVDGAAEWSGESLQAIERSRSGEMRHSILARFAAIG